MVPGWEKKKFTTYYVVCTHSTCVTHVRLCIKFVLRDTMIVHSCTVVYKIYPKGMIVNIIHVIFSAVWC